MKLAIYAGKYDVARALAAAPPLLPQSLPESGRSAAALLERAA
jgi:hypothetical protein